MALPAPQGTQVWAIQNVLLLWRGGLQDKGVSTAVPGVTSSTRQDMHVLTMHVLTMHVLTMPDVCRRGNPMWHCQPWPSAPRGACRAACSTLVCREVSAAAWPSEMPPPEPGSTGDQRGLTNLGLVDSTTIEVCCRAGTGHVRAERRPSGNASKCVHRCKSWTKKQAGASQCTRTCCSAGEVECQAERGVDAAQVSSGAGA